MPEEEVDIMQRIRHYPKLINPEGEVTPLCAKKPKPIDMTKASWTFQKGGVTCRKCLEILNRPVED